MASTQTRRPLPAVVFIGALTVLTAIVWVRVLDRGSAADSGRPSTCVTGSVAAPSPKQLPKPSAVTVLVLNATDRDRLAATTKLGLQRKGFKVSQATNDEPSYGGHGLLTGVGEIRYGPAATSAAVLLHYFLPGATPVPTDASATSVILALGAKYKFLKSRDSVFAQVKGRDIKLVGTLPPTSPAASPSC